jgi:hypothetical protein
MLNGSFEIVRTIEDRSGRIGQVGFRRHEQETGDMRREIIVPRLPWD